MKTTSIRYGMMRTAASRLDAPFYLNDAVAYYSGLKKCPYELTSVAAESSRVFFGNIFSRNFVKDEERGVPYLRASEIQKADLDSGGLYISKKQADKLSYLRLKRGWILVTCSGSLGNCVLADARFEQFIATHDLIRIVPEKNKLESGALYAFLASRYGYATLTHSQYGSVILHTNPEQVGGIQIPVFPGAFQKRIHKLITESARLREEADAALKESLKLFEDASGEHGFPHETLTRRATYRSICASRRRMDAQYQLGMQRVAAAKQSGGCEQVRIGDVAKRIFLAQRGRRTYVKNGLPFLSSSDMMLFNAKRSSKPISKATVGIDSMIVHENDILISCDGTVGNVIIVGHDLSGAAVSHHALRVVVDCDKMSPCYVFAYFKTALARRTIESSAYGSVIVTINADYIADMTIPMLPRKTYDRIVSLISDYKDKLATAADLENEAIGAVEAEIESWQRA